MRRRILFLSTIVIPFALLALVLLVLGRVQDSRSEGLLPEMAPAIEVVVDEPVLAPLYDPGCADAWERIPTNRGPYAYLTLNVNDPALSTNSGTWSPDLPQDGFYQVEAYIPAHAPIEWCTTNIGLILSDTVEARYEIHHVGGVTNKNARQRPLANQWLDLGLYPFKAGKAGYVRLTDLNSEVNFTSTISFSAMRFTFIDTIKTRYFPVISTSKPTATPSPGVQVSNKPGFDACILPSISKMQTWWDASPYWIYGLYLGGSSYATGCTKADSAWVSAVRQQGWSFIPTWVGPQAPCSVFPNKMSSDPAAAYQQGRSEAALAMTAAANVGLINASHGTVLYYDLEGFGSNASSECRLAASSFVNGWTGRLRELGQRAGVYGSGCASHIRDWAALPNVPDDIWAASWYTNTYDAQASVFGVLCLDNSLWASHQRIRQYAGGHKEVWGSQSNTIDSNIADGEVAIPGVTLAAARPAAGLPSQPLIQDMGWLSADQGWILAGGRLLWTADGGSTWQDQTPQENARVSLATASLATAFFIHVDEGWALPFPARPDEYRAYHTTDGGQTWLGQSLPLPPGEWQPRQVTFLDAANGWVTYRLMTSVLFSRGVMLKTEDGGKTWTAHDLPIGEPVFFDSPLSGWTAGGAAGDEFYTTADGGLTWQPADSNSVSMPAGSQLDPGKLLAANLPGQVDRLAFPSAQGGWAVTVEGDCQGEKASLEFACRQVSTLWKTVDGGSNWLPVRLPASGK